MNLRKIVKLVSLLKRAAKYLTYLPPAALVASVLYVAAGSEKLDLSELYAVKVEGVAPRAEEVVAPPVFVTFDGRGVEELVHLLEASWSLGDWTRVPNIAPDKLPLDLETLPSSEKKSVFLRSLLPHILAENERLKRDRSRALGLRDELAAEGALSAVEEEWLRGLLARYRVKAPADEALTDAVADRLLLKLNVIPPSLALAQAAIESAWGTSRFAKLGNNLFGQWVFTKDGGLVPLERPEGAEYSVAKFDSVSASVKAYMLNLNSLWAYRPLRTLRDGLSAKGEVLTGAPLAPGLEKYSVRRKAYVREIVSVIKVNDFARYDEATLQNRSAEQWRGILNGKLVEVSRLERQERTPEGG